MDIIVLHVSLLNTGPLRSRMIESIIQNTIPPSLSHIIAQKTIVIIFDWTEFSPILFNFLGNQTTKNRKINSCMKKTWKYRRDENKGRLELKVTNNLLAEASSFVAWTAALLLRESAAVFAIATVLIGREGNLQKTHRFRFNDVNWREKRWRIEGFPICNCKAKWRFQITANQTSCPALTPKRKKELCLVLLRAKPKSRNCWRSENEKGK